MHILHHNFRIIWYYGEYLDLFVDLSSPVRGHTV